MILKNHPAGTAILMRKALLNQDGRLKMQAEKVSFRRRLIVTGVLLSSLILGFILYVYQLLDKTAQNNITNIESSKMTHRLLNRISDQLHKTESDVYELAILPDKKFEASIHGNLDQLNRLSQELASQLFNEIGQSLPEENQHRQHYQSFRQLSQELVISVQDLENPVTTFCENAIEIEKRYPGIPILLNELLPRNNQFIEAVDLAIIDLKQSDRSGGDKDEILNLFTDVRYFWSQQTNWLRLFVANRYGVFGESTRSMERSIQNKDIYMEQVKKGLLKLEKYEQREELELQQSLSFNEMTSIIDDYEYYVSQVKKIYMSDGWRNDLIILKQDVKPNFLKVRSIVRELSEILNIYDQHSIHQSQSAASTVSIFVLITGATIFLTFAVGYFLFEKIIRRPLLQVAMALDAEAKGQTSNITIRNYVNETDILIQAFSNMKKQVRTRQQRLQSILDNAAEGILTIDENGLIETFNVAAQKLFGYEDEDITEKNIALLIPPKEQNKRDDISSFFNNGEGKDILGRTHEVVGKTRIGVTFPMSIKLGEMYLEDKRYLTAVVENISKRKAMIDNLQRLAEHDSLTGLYNRHYFTEELEKFVMRKIRGDKNYVALLYIDLDNFKYVNDTMGHLAGDQLIVEAASILNSRARDGDILARLGGDEFAVLLYRPDPTLIEEVAESFRRRLEEYTFKFKGKVVDVACSIGAAVLDDTIKTREQLLAKADFACHEAKRLGRNRVHVFTPDDDDSVTNMSNDIGWTHRIKHALEHDRFVLASQPICNTVTNEQEYAEILIRMLDEKDELIMPAGFLPAAERFGFISQIDTWVIEHSIKYINKQKALGNQIKLSINLSAKSIEDQSVILNIKNLINEYDIDPGSIMFEVTESAAMGNLQKASNTLRQLQELGCKTALDDFGIGYSSFAYLKDLPIDVVKIDGSFVKDSATDSLHYAMVRSINDIAHEMNKQTVAEFVENESVLAVLKELKVDYGQGYYLGKPEVIADFLPQKTDSLKSKRIA